jgi:hypothetical protein
VQDCIKCGFELAKSEFQIRLSAECSKFSLNKKCKECVVARNNDLPPDVKKSRGMVTSAQAGNRALGVAPPDFKREDVVPWLEGLGFRSELTGKLVYLEGGVDWMASFDRKDAKGPYMRYNIRVVAAEEQLREVDGDIPQKDDFLNVFKNALADVMGTSDLAARAAHAAMWRKALRDPKSAASLFLVKAVAQHKWNDEHATPPRNTATNLTFVTLVAKLDRAEFHDEYSATPMALPEFSLGGGKFTVKLTSFSLDRIVNSPTAAVPLVNHSDINTKVSIRLLNGLGAAHSGGICYSRKKLLAHLLDQNLLVLTAEERAAVQAEYDAA